MVGALAAVYCNDIHGRGVAFTSFELKWSRASVYIVIGVIDGVCDEYQHMQVDEADKSPQYRKLKAIRTSSPS